MAGRVLTPEEWAAQRQREEFREVIPRTEGSGLNGLLLRPKRVAFAGQNQGEQVFMLLRRHWFTNIGWVVNEVVSAIVPIIIYVAADAVGYNLVEVLGWKLFVVIVLMFYSFIITNTIRHLSDWYYNLYLVTNERVIDFDYHPFTSSGASESSLVSIQDVKQSSVGLFPSIFDFGKIEIFSAADRNVITFDSVPNPTLVRDKILDLEAVALKRLPTGADGFN